MNLGRFELALNVADLTASLNFYQKLGFHQIDGSEESGAVVIQSGECRIALYAGHIAENLINFRGGNIPAIAEKARTEGLTFEKEPFFGADGGMGALIRDPDGNAVYFVSHPNE